MRIYNPALGRFLSVDPLTSEYAYYTPYQFAGNSPIAFVDRDGEEEDVPTFVKTNFGTVALKKPDGYTLEELLEELRKPLTPKEPVPVETPSIFTRLGLTIAFVFTPLEIGQETPPWKYEMMSKQLKLKMAKPEDLQIITNDPSTLSDEYLMLVRQRMLNGTASAQDKLYRSEVQKRIVGVNDKYVVNPQHDPTSGKYKSNKSVIPSNHQALWDKRSFYDEAKNEWWSVEGSGKKATFHRFKGDNNGEYHWNGSNNGQTKSGEDYSIQDQHIPNDLKKSVGYN